MSLRNTLNDPLTINLSKQTRALLAILPPDSTHSSQISLASSPKALLSTLSRLLAVASLTVPISELFRPLLVDLCARWLHDQEDLEDRFVAFCMLIENHGELFPILSAFLRRPCFLQGPLNFVEKSPSIAMLDAIRLHHLLLAYYRLLRVNRLLPSDLLWPISQLSTLFITPHPDSAVKYLAIRCYSLHTGMAEVERVQLETRILGEPGVVECPLSYGQNIDGSRITVDGWLMPVLELERVHRGCNSVAAGSDFYLFEGDRIQPLTNGDLSPWTANIHGILMLKSSPSPPSSVEVVTTPSAIKALQQLAIFTSLRLPTLITSPPSSGKLLFLSQLASVVYPKANDQIVTVHLADASLDPRSLLGSYISSPTQLGTFEWKDGVLVRAMREGKWLVFKDIDRASMEVLGLIKPLTESLAPGTWIGSRASIDVPNRGRVRASERFAIFATRSVVPSASGSFPDPIFYGAHKFQELIVDAPSSDEIKMIISSRFPKLGGSLALTIIQIWAGVQRLGTTTSSRSVGLRELEKYCRRVEALIPSSHSSMNVETSNQDVIPVSALFPNLAFREELFLEARDPQLKLTQDRIAALVADHIGLDLERRQWVLSGRVPVFEEERDGNGDIIAICIGRVRLPARPPKPIFLIAPTRPFVVHKPAVCLLSRVATAISLHEPVLLTGETGTGKTSAITHLASLLRRPLISLNLSHQTESSDLLGGFRPVDARVPASELHAQFLDLFGSTFSRKKNIKFEESVRKAVQEGKWRRAVVLWRESVRLAKERIESKFSEDAQEFPLASTEADGPRKRRKLDQTLLRQSSEAWDKFQCDIDEFEMQHVQGQGKFAFDFMEGPLVKALRSGDWILLDEINLASPETLECITGLLSGPTASIALTEKGTLEPIPRHPNFRLFACMNPATDVGKKDLPPNIRARFTEIDVPPPDADRETLLSIIHQYIGHCAVGDKAAIMNVADFYTALKQLAEDRRLSDGSNHRPHYSMRTLTRALTFAADISPMYGLRRALWEGCLMAFTMVLDGPSADIATSLAHKHILSGVRNSKSLLTKEPSHPVSRSADEFVKFGPFYLEKGPLQVDSMEDYIMTPSVEKKLIDLARIVLTRRFPVLIEGPTSSGKTSAVEYLARRTGHQFIRINNHEHTDIQEYVGSYVSDPATGKLVFRDGLLVHALRYGHWIVLDELNLAPTDVLEALNRLLDDNRELVIPETHEVVRPHPHFILFATQNPPGLYAGRKVLSRAFRNRFLEVHFQDVPQAELESILCQRCRIAPSYGQRIVSVFRELQKRRQTGRVFESKQGFATLRDLFRWAGRDAIGYQELAENGYMLLAERARRIEDKLVVKEVIETVMKVRIDEKSLYDLQGPEVEGYIGCIVPSSPQVVWTHAMRRLFVLVSRAMRFNEPVLLVGETGSGKTSVCQLYAEVVSKHLHTLSCHQNTETADLIGGLRPVRSRGTASPDVYHDALSLLARAGIVSAPTDIRGLLDQISVLLKTDLDPSLEVALRDSQKNLLVSESLFEWHDGPLIRAMRGGDIFLLDEISLTDDSVLERLNSVLEPDRTIVLAERGGTDEGYTAVRATHSFKLLATMNPGGDYGKKELSPALRNRFTEIWVPPVDDPSDLGMIVESSWAHDALRVFTTPLLQFAEWARERIGDRSVCTLRDMLVSDLGRHLTTFFLTPFQAWVAFSNAVFTPDRENKMPTGEIFHHGAHMTFLDGLGSLPQTATYSLQTLQQTRDGAIRKLRQLVPFDARDTSPLPYYPSTFVQFGPFALPKGPATTMTHSFNLQAPTAYENALRVVRACQVRKPILLEGSPGVGKTSLVAALAKIAGYHLCRINLSDQTDLIDLFGSDLPVENGAPGEFAWKDAEFLQALQQGHWVLLDEMNLAPQAVLEGLNAVLDHRGTVYIPELGRSFIRHPSFRVFAAQNPLHQGGGRKGLPKSFLDRFTKVYVEELTPDDMLVVCREQYKECDEHILRAMIAFNARLNHEVVYKRAFGREGSPWEFNLRDIIRWGELLRTSSVTNYPRHFIRIIYLSRFRNVQDRAYAQAIFDEVFSTPDSPSVPNPHPVISSSHLQFGYYTTRRHNVTSPHRTSDVLQVHLTAIEAIGACLSRSWLVVVTGFRNSGKTSLIRTLANLSGNYLDEVHISKATDTTDILGGFEQVDHLARVIAVAEEAVQLTETFARSTCGITPRYQYRTVLQRELLSGQRAFASILQAVSGLLAELSMIDVDDSSLDAARRDLDCRVRHLAQVRSARGRFEWIDGPLIRAMKNGHWLVLDGANICNPSVLDRLNPLCEPNGTLVLTERGFVNGEVQILTPHPNFRLLMTVDPQYGELSRAMRNRSVEVSLLTCFTEEDRSRVLAHSRLPVGSTTATSCYVSHEQARRGILSVCSHESPQPFPSVGIDHDSILSSLVVHAPIMDAPDLQMSHPLVYFAVRSFPPSLHWIFKRYLGVSSPNKLLCSVLAGPAFTEVSKTLTSRLKRLSQTTPCPLDNVLPMDDFMVYPPCPCCTDRTEYCSLHALKLEILHLFAALLLDESDDCWWDQSSSSPGTAQAKCSSNLMEALQSVLAEVRAVSKKLLEQLLSGLSGPQSDYSTSANLLSISRKLRQALAQKDFDYSYAQILSKLISKALDNCSPAYQRLAYASAILEKAISPSSGLGLVDMWSQLRVVRPTEITSVDIRLLACLPIEVLEPVSRREQLEILAVATLPMHLKPDKTEQLVHISSQVKDWVSKVPRKNMGLYGTCNPVSLLVELQVLCDLHTENKDVITQMLQRLIGIALEEPNEDLRRFASYQHVIWNHDAGCHISPSIIATVETQWLEALWLKESEEVDVSGPHIIFGPTHLLSAVEKRYGHSVLLAYPFNPLHSQIVGVSLASLEEHGELVKRHIGLTVLQCFTNTSRLQQLTALFNQSVVLKRRRPSSISWVASNHEPLQEAIRHLTSALQYNVDMLSSLETAVSHLGRCWIALSRVVIDLFVPNVPIDPATMMRHAAVYAQDQADFLTQQIAFHVQLELRTAANKTNDVISYLEACAKDLSNIPHASASVPTRDNVTNLHTYWLEVSQFVSQVIHHSKIDDLVRALESRDASAFDREVVVQESISGFCQRIETLYTEFDDITCILRLAFAELRLGLHLMRWASQQSSSQKDTTELAASLTAFPSTRSAQLLQTLPAPSASLPAAELVIIRVAAAVHCAQFLSTPMTVRTTYEQAYRLWSIDRARDDQREQDLNSLYRANTTTHYVSTEAEAEEKEFLELFPTFEDALHPTENLDGHVSDKPTHHLIPDRQRQLLALHLELMGDTVNLAKFSRTTKFNALRQTFLRSWIGTHSSSLSYSLEKQSLHLQLSVLHGHLTEMCDISDSPSKSFNFYSDANIPEAKKASSVIQSLRTGLIAILRDWPDQMVLQHLIDRCDIILAFDFAAPIAKFLSALEQLLMQTEDWEMYANRDNSLKEHQHGLTTLIVEWRRLELSCWKGLLESQSQSFVGDVAEFWFRLYEVLIRGPLNAVEETATGDAGSLHGYLRQLPSLLDEFIQSSTLGQFQVRLDLLRSFEGFIHYIAPCESHIHQEALLRVGRIVHSSWRYFHLFVPQLSTLLRDQRRALEKEVEAFIKLASWKDVNVQALKHSAQRTHHQLYKIIHKFRDVLRQPVMDKMNPLFAGDGEGQHQMERAVFLTSLPLPFVVAFTDVASGSASVPSHLGNLHQTFGRFNGFISNTICQFLSKYTAQDVEQLSLDIILTARTLASHTIPPDLTKERREKYKKNLLLRKRKAWSDLLKELKRGGLSHNVKPEILNKLRDECWIRNQPLIPANNAMASAEKAEHYFDRLRGCLPALRKVLSGHHSDLGTRDLSRGISVVESGYYLALEGRSGQVPSSIIIPRMLSQALSGYTTLRQQADRLQVLSEHSETIIIDTYDEIEPMYNSLSHSVRALEELAEGMRVFSEIEKSISAVPDLIGRCQTLAASACMWRDRVFRVLQSCQVIMPSVLLRDDYDAVVDATRYLSELPGQLEEMSATCPQLLYILQPTREWICEQGSFSVSQSTRPLPEDAVGIVDGVIDALLITIQPMLRQCFESVALPEPNPETEEAKDNYIRLGIQTTSLFTALLDLPILKDRLNDASIHLSSLPHTSRQRALRRVMPFLSCFLSLAGELLESLARWTRALFKLDYVVCSVVHALGTQGFCIPPETEEGEAAGDEKGHATELGGTGLGKGTGNENVSKEIEDESQVEGLQGEDDDDGEIQREKGKDEENTIEMSEDFGGEMEDVPETEEGDENEEAEEDGEERPDEQLGELDMSDPAAVDEKLWGDEGGDDNEKGEDELQNDTSQEDQRKDSNVVAKESKKGKEKNGEKKAEDTKEEGQRDEKDKEEEEEVDVGDENLPEEMDPPNASGASIDQHIPDADTLDLPDDMHLDEDQDKQDDHGDDLGMEDISNEEHVSDDQMGEDVEERERDHSPDDDPMSAEPQDTEQQPPRAVDESNMDEEKDDSDEEGTENNAVAQPDLAAGDGDAGMSENEPQTSNSAEEGQQGSTSTHVEMDIAGDERSSREPEPGKHQSGDAVEDVPQPIPPSASDAQLQPLDPSSSAEGTQRGPAYAHQPPPALSSNPLRSLGDALKEVQQRLDEIFGPADQPQPILVPQHGDAEQVEYAHQEDAPENDDMQALGPAGEEQVAKLRELKLTDEGDKTDADAMDIDEFERKQDLKEAKDVAMERLEAEKTAERPAPDIEGAIVHTERDGGVIHAQSHRLPDPSAPKAEDDMEPEPETPSSELVLTALTDHASNPTPTSASHLWTLYTTLTAPLSLALCESLRLILAPTLATRLRGDFRSGKRLNMRRVVAWVASEYTKDRIWMRRVKPSGREYQVLLAVDDSASMRNGGGGSSGGGAVHLAYQTVALVVQALGKLEVGEVGVARFGEGWELVRGFGSDATGAKDWGSSPTEGGRVLNAFTFSQPRTDVAAFLEGSLSVLEAARENAGSTSGRELWQLEIIISDGICQDHDKLRRILRKAKEMRVLVVFIIIDALNNASSTSNPSGIAATSSTSGENQSSILTLSQVSYKPSPTTGLMELTMERYLDSFPFEYYVVLRDVEALPRVLADTLREFFERVNEE
ncbi:midasin [Lanmaoa asiatica]|nr:midasin [Lanmaoa asiatica]